MDHGLDEEAAVQTLGTPRNVAREILAEHYVNTAQVQRTPASVLRAVLATISLSFFNLIVVLGPFICCVAICISLFAVAISLMLSPIAGIALLVTGDSPSPSTVVWAMCLIGYPYVSGTGNIDMMTDKTIENAHYQLRSGTGRVQFYGKSQSQPLIGTVGSGKLSLDAFTGTGDIDAR